MKALNKYIIESNSSACLDNLKTQIKKMSNGDRIKCVWGVREKGTDSTGKDRMVDHALSIDKLKGNNYEFCSNFWFSKGNDMIKEICKSIGIKKISTLLGIAIIVNYDDLIKILDVMPKFFNKYSNTGKSIWHFLTFDYNEACEVCAKDKRPFDISTLEEEIKSIEKSIADLANKKKQLEELKQAQKKDDEYEDIWLIGKKH